MIILVLIVIGLCLGSFTNALVWRVHLKEKAGKKRLPKSQTLMHGRSMCPNCQHQLAAKDLVPLFSWLSLGGKCRYCHKPISWQYPAVEALMTGLFVFSYAFWPTVLSGYQLVLFGLWLLTLVGLVALAVYDLRWYILPDRLVTYVTGLAVVAVTIELIFGQASDVLPALFGGVACFGFFWLIFQLSAGKWIGGGDVKLSFALGLIGGSLANAFLIVFGASLLGCGVILGMLPFKKVTKDTKLPFGPLLIAATILVFFFGASLVNWYKQQVGL